MEQALDCLYYAYNHNNLQVILNRGDIGHHMYFICMGEVEVLPHMGEDPVATLKEGDMFGEVRYSLSPNTCR